MNVNVACITMGVAREVTEEAVFPSRQIGRNVRKKSGRKWGKW